MSPEKKEIIYEFVSAYGLIILALIIGLACWAVKHCISWWRIWRSPEALDAEYEDLEDDYDDPEVVYR